MEAVLIWCKLHGTDIEATKKYGQRNIVCTMLLGMAGRWFDNYDDENALHEWAIPSHLVCPRCGVLCRHKPRLLRL